MKSNRIIRITQVLDRTGYSRSQLYTQIDRGLFPEQVKLSERAVGWPEAEVELICQARIGGASDDFVAHFVDRLHKERALLAYGSTGSATIPKTLAALRQGVINARSRLMGPKFRSVTSALESIAAQIEKASSDLDGLLVEGA